VQVAFHLHQPLTVFGAEARERNSGHLGDHFADDILVDDAIGFATLFAPFSSDGLFLLAKLVRFVSQRSSLFKVLVGDRVLFVLVELLDVFVQSFKSGGLDMLRKRIRAPASSITSIALSGKQRAVM
jgi:hypothetical protein